MNDDTRDVNELIDALLRGDAVDDAMRAAIIRQLSEFAVMIMKSRPRPAHRPRSIALDFAVSIMHELIMHRGARTQAEAARAVLGPDKYLVPALKEAYKRAKKDGKLRGRVVGPWVDRAVRNLQANRGTEVP